MNDFLIDNLFYLLIGLTILVVMLMLYVFSKVIFVRKKLSTGDLRFILSKWEEVERDLPNNPKLAVLEADKLLDYALGKLGKKGNLGEKLKKSKTLFSDLDSVWAAHKLRNRIAHEVSMKLSHAEASKATNRFGKALKDLKAL